jgi:hypothetical protein
MLTASAADAAPESAVTTAGAATPWRAGAARINITPSKMMWMAGYGSRTEPAHGKLTELWAKALVVEDAAKNRGLIITSDLIVISGAQTQRVCAALADRFGLQRHQIILNASHTHSGPVVGKSLGPLHYLGVDEHQRALIDEYEVELQSKLVELVAAAIDALQPARLQWGCGFESFAVNRRENPADQVPARRDQGTLLGPVDHDVPVLSVRDANGQLVAVLFGYACHATCLSLQHWSGDYPGYAQIELEAKYPECVAMFWAGCGGDQNPLPRRTIELAEEYGVRLAAAVETVLSAALPALPAELTTKLLIVEAPLTEVPTRSDLEADVKAAQEAELKAELKSDSSRVPQSVDYQRRWAEFLLAKIDAEGELKPWYPYPVSVWTIGNQIDFVALGGEVVVDYALRLKRERYGRRTWVAAYSHDVMAYIPSLRVLKEGGYEGGESNVYYGLPAVWGDQIENTIVNAVHQLVPLKNP